MELSKGFAKFANWTAHAAGHPATFISCLGLVIAWAICGPFFGFSETWQLVINTGTTIVTFLMVFLIQNSQNRDGTAIQAKLDELIRTSTAQNSFIGIENLSQDEVDEFRRRCEKAARERGAADAAADAVKQEEKRRPRQRQKGGKARSIRQPAPAAKV